MTVKIHKEGYKILAGLAVFLLAINFGVFWFFPNALMIVGIITAVLFLLVLQFFRNPNRKLILTDNNIIYAPADGKIVTIEEVVENEYFNAKRLQVSIFMSPVNVHVNRNPVSGTINYFRYHPGKYLVAWHPKSSTENERTTTVIQKGDDEILLRQIAGFLAKRIVNYVDVGDEVEQGTDMGFIKFGSRVDLYLPLDTKLEVKIGQKVKGNKTILARL
ncbi:MAG TPA: phosphatidylserine decarboxylase family protein [Phaeodactylibacter sp.]|nr:phosphatidylserine decarboxylase family protein [Phaeodactylibacter sp.]